MSNSPSTELRCSFNGSVRIEGWPDRLTSDAGVLALRKLDQRLGISTWVAERLIDPRHPVFITHPLVELQRARLYLIAAGRRHQDHADWLAAELRPGNVHTADGAIAHLLPLIDRDPGELFLDYFFLLTNWTAQERADLDVLRGA